MKTRLSLLALAALASTAAVCNPSTPGPTPPVVIPSATRAVTTRTASNAPIAGCSVTYGVPDKSQTASTSASGYVAFTVPVDPKAGGLNVAIAASCPGQNAYTWSYVMPATGNQDVCLGGSGSCGGGNQVVLGPNFVPTVPPLPPAPTRDQLITAQNWGMQGETFSDPACDGGQPIPLWDPEITPMLTSCRLSAYRTKHDTYGDRKVIIPISWAYLESGLAIINTQGTDWSSDMATVRARVLEAIQAGLYVDLNFAGDGESVVTSTGACAWQYNDPVGHSYGELCAELLIPLVDAALKGDGTTLETGDLRAYVEKTLGWDGSFYGINPPEITRWASAARSSCPFCVLAMEFNVGHIPLGNGPADYDAGGAMSNFDVVKAEFDNSPGYHEDATWQVSDRLLCGAWRRPADMPAGDDPSAPCYVGVSTSRGKIYVEDFENDTYLWTRNRISLADVVAHDSYNASIGWSLIDGPITLPSGGLSAPELAHIGRAFLPSAKTTVAPEVASGGSPYPSVLWSQFVALGAMRAVPCPAPALRDHVAHIVGLGSEEQVIWSNARRDVAAVQDLKAVWNLAEMNQPGRAVGADHRASAGRQGLIHECPVTARHFGTGPQPAPVRLLHLGTEAGFKGWRWEAHDLDSTQPAEPVRHRPAA